MVIGTGGWEVADTVVVIIMVNFLAEVLIVIHRR
jgi:hypothetical protein